MGAVSSKESKFKYFSQLPPDIRSIIWRYHFTRPRLYIIRRIWIGGPQPLPYMSHPVPHPKLTVNREVYDVAVGTTQAFRRTVAFTYDVTRELDLDLLREHSLGRDSMPLFVDWEEDLIWATPNIAAGFLKTLVFFSGYSWTGNIQKLVVYFDLLDICNFQTQEREFLENILERMEVFRSLKEFYIVCRVGRETSIL